MWIFLGVVAFLVLLIIAILLLPIDVTLKSDENGDLYFRYKILFKTFGENPNPDNPILKTLKKTSGIERIETKNLKASAQKSGVLLTVNDTVRILFDLLKEVVSLFKHCYAKKFEIKIMVSDNDAADAAIRYGSCCAVVYPLAAFITSAMKVKKKGRKIDISCGFAGEKEYFNYHFLIRVRLFRVLAAFLRIAFTEAKRKAQDINKNGEDAQQE